MDLTDLGPAMLALNERRRRFVLALVMQDIPNYTDAAEEAGFGGRGKNRRNVLKQIGSRLVHEESVLEAIREVAGKHLRGSGLLMAAKSLERMVNDPKHKNHARAVEAMLDRTGLGVEQKISVDHTHTDLTGAAMIERIRELALKHGMDPAKLLGGNAPVPQQKVIEGCLSEIDKGVLEHQEETRDADEG
jgi:phage terminase small subunit